MAMLRGSREAVRLRLQHGQELSLELCTVREYATRSELYPSRCVRYSEAGPPLSACCGRVKGTDVAVD